MSSCCLWLYSDKQQKSVYFVNVVYPDGFLNVWTRKKHMKSDFLESDSNQIWRRFETQFQSDFYSSVWTLWLLESDFKLSFTQGIYEWKLFASIVAALYKSLVKIRRTAKSRFFEKTENSKKRREIKCVYFSFYGSRDINQEKQNDVTLEPPNV